MNVPLGFTSLALERCECVCVCVCVCGPTLNMHTLLDSKHIQ